MFTRFFIFAHSPIFSAQMSSRQILRPTNEKYGISDGSQTGSYTLPTKHKHHNASTSTTAIDQKTHITYHPNSSTLPVHLFDSSSSDRSLPLRPNGNILKIQPHLLKHLHSSHVSSLIPLQLIRILKDAFSDT